MLKNPSTKFSGLDPEWLCTNVCRTYATTDVVGHNEYRRYDLFTTSVADLWPVERTDRTYATLRWPVSAIPCILFLFLFRQPFKFSFSHNMYLV